MHVLGSRFPHHTTTMSTEPAKLSDSEQSSRKRVRQDRQDEEDFSPLFDMPHPDCDPKEVQALYDEMTRTGPLPKKPIKKFSPNKLWTLQRDVTKRMEEEIKKITDGPCGLGSNLYMQIADLANPLTFNIGGKQKVSIASLKLLVDPYPPPRIDDTGNIVDSKPRLVVQGIQVEPQGSGIGPIVFRSLLKLLRTRSICAESVPFYREGTPRLLAQQVLPKAQPFYKSWHEKHFCVTREGPKDAIGAADYWIDPLPLNSMLDPRGECEKTCITRGEYPSFPGELSYEISALNAE